MNFLIKPFDENDIEKIMKTAAELINTNKHILVLEARKELLRIPVSEIRYIESSGRYIIVHDSGGEYKLKGKGLLAQAISHEVDHLEGILFVDKIIPGTMEVIK